MRSRLLREELLPRAALFTPERSRSRGASPDSPIQSLDDVREAATRIHKMGAHAVLIKGGHLEGLAIDVLFDGAGFTEFPAPRLKTHHTHGTGCTYSAAIAALLARGLPLPEAVGRARRFVHEAIRSNPGLGRGCGPVNHHAEAS